MPTPFYGCFAPASQWWMVLSVNKGRDTQSFHTYSPRPDPSSCPNLLIHTTDLGDHPVFQRLPMSVWAYSANWDGDQDPSIWFTWATIGKHKCSWFNWYQWWQFQFPILLWQIGMNTMVKEELEASLDLKRTQHASPTNHHVRQHSPLESVMWQWQRWPGTIL